MAGIPIHAVIGVRHDGPSTWYVRRSEEMANYPGVWSLMSIQFAPDDMPDPKDLDVAAGHFARLSEQRLGGVPIDVVDHIVTGSSDMNPMGVEVTLHLYKITLPSEPVLDSRYYVDSGWLSPEEYERRSAGQPCGLCLRLWSDHAWLTGLTDRPFVPRPG